MEWHWERHVIEQLNAGFHITSEVEKDMAKVNGITQNCKNEVKSYSGYIFDERTAL